MKTKYINSIVRKETCAPMNLRKIVFFIFLSTLSSAVYSLDMPINWTTWDNGQYIDHYRVYWGTSKNNYTNESADIPSNITTYTVTNLSAGGVYYFAVKAFDAVENESNFSNEVSNFNIVTPINNFTVNTSNSTSFTISGVAIANSSIEIFINNASNPIAVTGVGNDGSWGTNIDFTSITQGSVVLKAVQNGGQISTVYGIHDSVPPAAPYSLLFSIE